MVMIDAKSVLARAATANPGPVAGPPEDGASDESVQQALASLSGQQNPTTPAAPVPGELKYKLTMLLFPAILLVFVALYVASLASGIDPEVGLFRAGGASLVLAIIGRAAIGIIGDDSRLILNDSQIVAMARSGSVRDYLAAATGEHGDTSDAADTEQPSRTAQAVGFGGKV
jgi:hypothetical protein